MGYEHVKIQPFYVYRFERKNDKKFERIQEKEKYKNENI